MKIDLSGKIALVTGAGRGLGEAISIDLSKAGSKIIAISRNSQTLKKLKFKLKGKDNYFYTCDLQKENSVDKLINFLNKEKLNPDIVINNVGGNLGIIDPLVSSKKYKEVFHLNLNIAIDINRHVLKKMIKKKWGRIINVSSISALENQGPPSYCAAKAALNAYTRSLGRYVSKHNVIMTSVMPGAILTKGGYWDKKIKTDKSHVRKYLSDRMAINRFGKATEISSFVTFLASDFASFCPGSGFLIDGGQGRLFQEF